LLEFSPQLLVGFDRVLQLLVFLGILQLMLRFEPLCDIFFHLGTLGGDTTLGFELQRFFFLLQLPFPLP
jgi:hypothetical protein